MADITKYSSLTSPFSDRQCLQKPFQGAITENKHVARKGKRSRMCQASFCKRTMISSGTARLRYALHRYKHFEKEMFVPFDSAYTLLYAERKVAYKKNCCFCSLFVSEPLFIFHDKSFVYCLSGLSKPPGSRRSVQCPLEIAGISPPPSFLSSSIRVAKKKALCLRFHSSTKRSMTSAKV